jgi:hypothetical protein
MPPKPISSQFGVRQAWRVTQSRTGLITDGRHVDRRAWPRAAVQSSREGDQFDARDWSEPGALTTTGDLHSLSSSLGSVSRR